MSSGVVTAVAYLCTLIGLGATAAYALSFYILPYNQLFLEGESGHDERDLPYIIAMIECAISGATFIIGVLAFSNGKPKKRVALIALLFFIVLTVMEGTFGVIRAWNLGFFGDDMEKTCSDTQSFTGCPTTRFEAIHHEILYTVPRGGECSFWFWGPEMKTRLQFQCANEADYCDQKEAIDDYMDWSKHQSYGWRDDPDEIKLLMSGSRAITTINKVHNMKEIILLQSKAGFNSSIAAPLSTQPSIAYCWYWGCNKVCNSLRWSINRWWFVSSLSLATLHIINLLLSVVIYRSKNKQSFEDGEVAYGYPINDEESPVIDAPVIGRRRRTLNKNPSVLRF